MFDLERRIYRIDRLRLNPGGVPVRGVVYFLGLVVATLAAGSAPVLGLAMRALPWYAVDVVLPGLCATVLTVISIEGRPFHVALGALGHHWLASQRPVFGQGSRWYEIASLRAGSTNARWRPPEIVLLPDGSDPTIRRLRYRGPGAVLVSIEHTREGAPVTRSHGLRSAFGRPQVRLRPSPQRRRAADFGGWQGEAPSLEIGVDPEPRGRARSGIVIALASRARLETGGP